MQSHVIEKFLRDGWAIVDVPQPDVVRQYADRLQKKAHEITGIDCRLSDLHRHIDDAMLKTLHKELTEYFWQQEFSLRFGQAFLPVLNEIVGLDIMVQYRPFLRLARPHQPEDNIGYHRDTQYGQTPYELAVHIPFVDLDDQASLRVISGSHRLPEDTFPLMQGIKTSVTKGSVEHTLGKPYAPKRMSIPAGMKTDTLAMRVGQAAIFTPALFHGQEVNLGATTRVTTDVRFVNPNANANIKVGKVHVGYVPVASSPLTRLAQEYYQAQRQPAEAEAV